MAEGRVAPLPRNGSWVVRANVLLEHLLDIVLEVDEVRQAAAALDGGEREAPAQKARRDRLWSSTFDVVEALTKLERGQVPIEAVGALLRRATGVLTVVERSTL